MRTNRTLKSLGLALAAALCLVAAMAASAQAVAPNWMVNGAEATETLEVKGIKDGEIDFNLLSKSGLTKIEILCEELTVKDGLLFVGGTSLAELEFKKNCVTRLGGVAAGACKPAEPIIAKVKDKLVLREDLTTHKIVALDLFEPEVVNTPFTTITLGTGECSIGNSLPVTGSALIEDCNKAVEKPLETEAKTHLIQQAPEGLYKQEVAGEDTLKFGNNAATLDGSEVLELIGAHAGQNWSGLAP